MKARPVHFSKEINTYDTKNAKSIQMPNNKTAIIEKKVLYSMLLKVVYLPTLSNLKIIFYLLIKIFINIYLVSGSTFPEY